MVSCLFKSGVLEKYKIQPDHVDFVRFLRQIKEEYNWFKFLAELLKKQKVESSKKIIDAKTEFVYEPAIIISQVI